MITEEQARAAVLRENHKNHEFFVRETRIISLEPTKLSLDKPTHDGAELGHVELEDDAWSCHFEWRDMNIYGDASASYTPWYSGHCYIVEPKPGPYIIK